MVFFSLFLAESGNSEAMVPFIGEYSCRPDAKGRMLFPSAFRKQLSVDTGDRFVIRKDVFENCLVLYPMAEWERLNRLIRERTNSFNREHLRFLRMYFHGAAEVMVDGSGRILIPRRLLEAAGIGSEAVMAGQPGRIEIWDAAQYEKNTGMSEDFARLAEKILGSSLNGPDSE